jgi:hypothetical protein
MPHLILHIQTGMYLVISPHDLELAGRFAGQLPATPKAVRLQGNASADWTFWLS